MQCESCHSELEPVMVVCPACGARVRRLPRSDDDVDWRARVKETVERHKAKRRREQARNDDEARQLSIFPDDSEPDDDERAARARRAEIRARVEQRLSQRRGSTPSASSAPQRDSPKDAGEVSLRGGAVAAAVPEPALPLSPSTEGERAIEPPMGPTTNALAPADAAVLHPLSGEGQAAGSPEPFIAFGLASPGERILGGLIDVAFVSLIQLTLFYLTTHLVAERLDALPASAVVAMVLVGAVLAASYFLFFWSLSGQTLGKLLTGGRVVLSTGKALGLRGAAVRLLGMVLALLPLGAGFLGLWTDRERRGWHDRLAGSKVVRG